jgi:hypothetical protein
MISLNRDLTAELNDQKFAFVKGEEFNLQGHFHDFVKLTNSWESMEEDVYYGNKDKGTRLRRYSDFNYNPATDELTRVDHRAYFQSEKMNAYVGGQQRHFEDFSDDFIDSQVLRSLIKLDFDIYQKTLPEEDKAGEWQCQLHQIRIEINPNQKIEITPEGIHSDGYPFSGVHFWGKYNISGAQSKLYTSEKFELCTEIFEETLDTIYFFDKDMFHYVTPAETDEKGGYRQILAISFSKPGTPYDTVR